MYILITIGDAVLIPDRERTIGVRHLFLGDAAPRFPGETEIPDVGDNVMLVDAESWRDFCGDTGLYDLFRDHLMPTAGTFQLLPLHVGVIDEHLEAYIEEHPQALPGWGEGYDPHLAILQWLRFWCHYAILNCALPSVCGERVDESNLAAHDPEQTLN